MDWDLAGGTNRDNGSLPKSYCSLINAITMSAAHAKVNYILSHLKGSALDCFESALFDLIEHLWLSDLVSRFVPPAKSQSIDHYIGDIGRDLTDPPRSHRSNRLLS